MYYIVCRHQGDTFLNCYRTLFRVTMTRRAALYIRRVLHIYLLSVKRLETKRLTYVKIPSTTSTHCRVIKLLLPTPF